MRVGIVGAGSMGTAHAAGWVAAGADLVGVLSAGGESARRLAGKYGARAYPGLRELLADVEVVDLCVPSDLHHPMTLDAAAAGAHVVCEKPIALSIREGREMIEACERAGVRLFVGMVLRFFPQYRAAAELVRQGAIGDLGVLRLKRVSYPPRAGQGSWFDDTRRSGGVLVDMLVHDFDYASLLGGDVVRVHARAAGGEPPASERYALVTLRFASGAMALVEGGWVYPAGVFRTAFDLAGSEGVIEWDSDTTAPLRRYLAGTAGEPSDVGLPLSPLAEDPYVAEISHVHRALEAGEPFAVSPEEALAALRIALAARQSLRTGASVAPLEVG